MANGTDLRLLSSLIQMGFPSHTIELKKNTDELELRRTILFPQETSFVVLVSEFPMSILNVLWADVLRLRCVLHQDGSFRIKLDAAVIEDKKRFTVQVQKRPSRYSTTWKDVDISKASGKLQNFMKTTDMENIVRLVELFNNRNFEGKASTFTAERQQTYSVQ